MARERVYPINNEEHDATMRNMRRDRRTRPNYNDQYDAEREVARLRSRSRSRSRSRTRTRNTQRGGKKRRKTHKKQ